MTHCVRDTYMFEHLTSIFFFFFNDTATTEIYTLSLHDALPISLEPNLEVTVLGERAGVVAVDERLLVDVVHHRSEEHTSELQSQSNLVCRLLLEKKKLNEKPSYLSKLNTKLRTKSITSASLQLH